jgi:single-stranded-DNA-specific exonuclease
VSLNENSLSLDSNGASFAIWQKREVLPQIASPSLEEASKHSKIPRLIFEILKPRGFSTEQEIRQWLTPSLKELRDPLSIIDLKKAVDRIILAFEKKEKICVYADYDLDGTSGIALFAQGLNDLGFRDFLLYQPSRLKEGYGLKNQAIQKLYDQGARLLISIDLGISNKLEVDFANSLGMEVIITDHHLPPEQIPLAHAVVNPNRKDCTSQLQHLCGAGVAFFLILALRREMTNRGLLEKDFDPKTLLDCFAIATLTDMVPLIDENRILCKHGLQALRETKRPGLKILLQELGLLKNLTSYDVTMKFAPKLNALSRLETSIRPLDLYLIEDVKKARSVVNEVLGVNESRRSLQKEAEDLARAELQKNPPKNFIWIYSDKFHRGILGLLATKLSQEFLLPTFVGALEDDKITGSARLAPNSKANLTEALGHGQSALRQFGGHAQAAGFECLTTEAEKLRELFADFFSSGVKREPLILHFDAEAQIDEINADFMMWYDHFVPIGVGAAMPLIKIKDVHIKKVRELKGGHMSLELEAHLSGQSLRAIWFSPEIKDFAVGQKVEVLVEVSWNEFMGSRQIQLQIKHLAKVRQS